MTIPERAEVGFRPRKSADRVQPGSRRQRLALGFLLAASLTLNVVALHWGLPNGNRTWAADALQPLTPLSVGRHVWFGEPWNSGWFYFKYPVGHPNLLLAAQAPVLVWMRWTGELGRPSPRYPHGFRNPEWSLSVLALVTRAVSALLGVGCVWLTYATVALYLPHVAAWLAASVLAGSAPFVFYSHTSNVDVPLLFWLMLSLWAALRSARSGSMLASAVAGAAAAMALLTKEQGIGFLAAVPLVWLIEARAGRTLCARALWRHAALAGLVFAGTTVGVANVAWNPSGYWNRWRFLMGTLPEEIRQRYAPYQFFTRVPRAVTWQEEMTKLGRVSDSLARSLPPGGKWLALAGLVALVVSAPRLAVVAATLTASYYLGSLRALELVPIRYTLPVLWVATATLGGFAVAVSRLVIRSGLPAWIGTAAVSVWLAWSLAPGAEVVRLLLRDPRYDAEAWLQGFSTQAKRVEVYQPETYLPRFPKRWSVVRVPLAERQIERFWARSPDLVVLSSGGKAGLVGRYARSWRPGEQLFTESALAREFFRALRAGELGYDVGPVFARWTWLDLRIHSLNPTIEVYTRKPSP